MIVRDVMSTPPHTCQPTTDLAAVTKLMWDEDCGFVPVIDAAGRLAGVVTDRDIAVAAATKRQPPERIAAAQAMSNDVHACLASDTLEHVLGTMSKYRVRRVPVIDAEGQLQGVVSMNDIVRAVGRRGAPPAGAVVSALSAVCAPRALEAAGT